MQKFVYLAITILLLASTSHTAMASWAMKKDQHGLCRVQTSFHYKREQYQLEIYDNKDKKVLIRFTRKHRKHIPGITSLDALFVKYPKGRVVDLVKLNRFRIESTRTEDIISSELNAASIEHLKKGRALTIEYTLNRTDQYAHDVELKFAAENIDEMLQCRKKQTKTRKAKTDKWRFYRSSKALELGCHAEISTKRSGNTYRLLYIKHESSPGFIFIDHNKADGEIDSINHFIVTDTRKQIHHIDVEGEFWELNGKEAFFIPVKRPQLKLIVSGRNMSVNYASDKHKSIEQTFRLRGMGSAISKVNKCK